MRIQKTLSISETAKVLDISDNWAYLLVKDGTLDAFKVRNKWYVYSESVYAYKARSSPETITEHNGEHVFLAWDFMQDIGIPFTTYQAYISCGKLKVIKIHSRNYITESEKNRFLKRNSEIMGRRVVSMDKAAEITGHSRDWISHKIKKGEIEAIAAGVKYLIFLDSLQKLAAQERRKGNILEERAFLRIPTNGKKRVKRSEDK